MHIKAQQRFDPRVRYDVTAADGSKIGDPEGLRREPDALYVPSPRRPRAEIARGQSKCVLIALFAGSSGFIPYLENVAN